MGLINAYGNPIITNWELDDNGKKISILMTNETRQVIGNKIVLEGLPDEQYRVFIDGFVELNIKEQITELNQFKVDYRNGTGVVFVHPDLNGQWITVSRYASVGLYFMPSSRIWVKLDINGNVIQTLDEAIEIIDQQSNNIQALQGVRIYEGVTAPTDTKFWYDPSDE